jgi:hypothetical protein
MQKILLLSLVLLAFGSRGFSQETITPADAIKYIGKEVTVCGQIYGGKFLDKAKNSPTFLNMGAPYPDQPLTIVIWGEVRKTFSYKPEVQLNNKTVCITGKIETYKEKPQIVIAAVSQIQEK